MASILIVEDESSIARGLEDDLELEGYEKAVCPGKDERAVHVE